MVDRGLLPEFSDAAIAETQRLAAGLARRCRPPTRATCAACCGRRSTTTTRATSISCRSPRRCRRARREILVAIADVDALVRAGLGDRRPRAHQHDLGLHRRADLPDAARDGCRPTSRRSTKGRSAWRSSIEMQVDDDGAGRRGGRSIARVVVNRAKLAYNSVAAWLDGTAAGAAASVSAVAGLADKLRLQDRVAQALRRRRHAARRAATCETLEARAGVRRRRGVDLRLETPQPRQGADRGLHGRRQRRHRALPRGEGLAVVAPRAALARALGAHRRAGRASYGDALPAEPDAARARRVPGRSSARRIRMRFPDLSLAVVKLLGSRRIRASSCRASSATGHFGLAVRDYTHSTAPNRRFPDLVTQRLLKAALAGEPAPYSVEELAALAQHCTVAGGQRGQGRAAGAQVGGGAAAAVAHRRDVRRASSPARRTRGPGCASAASAGRRARRARRSRGSTSATASASSWIRTDVAARLHRLLATE